MPVCYNEGRREPCCSGFLALPAIVKATHKDEYYEFAVWIL
jgi:hypothetical protein